MTYHFALHFQKPTTLTPPAAHVVLNGTIPLNGEQAITPECSSLQEVEEQIDGLVKELQSIKQAARRKFAIEGF